MACYAFGMPLAFLLYPERDLHSAGQRWQQCGLQALGWPDDDTVILGVRGGSRAQVMLEDHPNLLA